MPEYLAPGVYVEETSFRSKSIEGVSTTTTGFVGPARFGPISIEPDVITSVMEFERVYGDRNQLSFGSDQIDNYLWHAARAFFEEGGKRLYVARIFRRVDDSPGDGQARPYARPVFGDPATPDGEGRYVDGHARAELKDAGGVSIRIAARFPGAAGNVRVRFTLRGGQNVLAQDGDGRPRVSVHDKDVVLIQRHGLPNAICVAEPYYDTAEQRQTWKFTGADGDILLNTLHADPNPKQTDLVRVVTVAVTVIQSGLAGSEMTWDGLALDPRHRRAGMPDSLFDKFCAEPTSLADARTLPIVITLANTSATGPDVLTSLFDAHPEPLSPPLSQFTLESALETRPLANVTPDHASDPRPSPADLSLEVPLSGGNDGQRPSADDYAGREDDATRSKTGLVALEDIEDIAIVAAPGSTFGLENGYRSDATAIVNSLVAHATKMRYRIAVLDSGERQTISQVRAMRGKIDSSYAALYYPWVRVLDPVTGTEKNMPPSGFVAGIYARNDITRAVYKAPANEVVMSALGFELLLNKSQQDVLNPEGINCFRFFEGRGFRLWGARTTSSDPEWKYVNLRRYFAYLEHSIDRGTQWAVFEPNGDALWANVRRTVEDFLLNEWQMGALLGEKPDKAFFVKCDRTTMSQNDLDNGRLVCLIGIAPLRPAEFVIFRIGQWTADRKV
jgi:phage tail sheath protein FI